MTSMIYRLLENGEIKWRFQMEHFHPVTFSASSGNIVPTFNLNFWKAGMLIIKYTYLFTTLKYKKKFTIQ